MNSNERKAWLISLHDPDCFYVTHNGGCDCIDGVVAERAATRMRQLCVEKVREMRDDYEARRAQDSHPAFAHYYTVCRNAADGIITALSSLTLDQVEKKQ